jgi:hypothetical protein
MVYASDKFSPRSGWSKIAQRFIAGKGRDHFFQESAERTREAFRFVPTSLPPVSRARYLYQNAFPVLKCWAISDRPLRGL